MCSTRPFRRHGWVFLLFLLPTPFLAQSGDASLLVSTASVAGVNRANFDRNPVSSNKRYVPPYYRHHKSLPEDYSGFTIELIASAQPLRRDFTLFKQFGNVYYDLLPNGTYSYCILINFSNRKAIDEYLKMVIRPKAPDAKVVEYRGGKRY